MWARVLAAAVFVALASCGGGGDPSPPPDPGGSAGDGGGSGDAGGGGTAGDPAGAPPDDGAAGGDGGGASPGSGAPGESPSGGGGGSAGLTLERLAGDGDCAGLVPATAPAPIAVRREPAGACVGGTSDGTGAVALGARDGDAVRWQAYGGGGRLAGSFAGAQLFPQPRGWHVLRVTPREGEPLVEHVAIAPDGSEARASAVSEDPALRAGFRWSFAQDPLGGSLVLFRSVSLAGNHWFTVRAHRFAEGGGARWPGGVPIADGSDPSAPYALAGGVSRRGDALALHQTSAFLHAQWLGADGAPPPPDPAAEERAELVLGEGLSHAVELKPLLDGSLALRSDGTWRRVYAYGAASSAPLPEWLAARAAWTFQLTRGNRGYALLPPPGLASGDCTQEIELRSPSGRLCGRVVLREDATGCTTGRVDQGWDGTVVQQSGKDACTYRWWPRLLAGG